MKSSSGSGSDEEVKMISGEAPIVFAKACELFIQQLTHKSWTLTLQSKRRILHKHDVASAVLATDLFDFLLPLVISDSDFEDEVLDLEVKPKVKSKIFLP
uniref:Transcription factor CBF/NF-Y/archaeal histone domain-containing protein n=1 Tax=Cannabis sativa TaxID=3483 RepID=A0A803PLB9_CANSA